MTITVEYFAQLRTATGTQSETHELPPDATVGDLVMSIRKRHADALGDIIGHDGDLPGWITIVLNGSATSDPATTLPDEATVRLLSPISGG